MNPFDKGFLGHKELRSLTAMCAGVALLIGISLALSGSVSLPGSSQAAATALAVQQGVPSYTTGSYYVSSPSPGYPAQVQCYANWSYQDYGCGQFGGCAAECTTIGPSTYGLTVGQQDTFSAGIFSVDLGAGAGQSVYATRTYTVGGYTTTDLGPSEAGCNAVNVTDAGWECTDGQGGFLGPASWDCNQYTIPPGSSLGGVGPPGSPFECTYSTPVAPAFSGPANTVVGTAPSVSPGQNMTLEWSCLPSRAVIREQKVFPSCLFGCSGSWVSSPIYSVGLASSVSGSSSSGGGFTLNTGNLIGSQTINAPTTAGTYNYTLTCNGGTGAMTIPVTVTGTAPTPTVSFTVNGQTGGVTLTPGQTAHFVASYTPAGSYTGTAINDFRQLPLTSQDASTPKTYDFNTPGNPAAPGSYSFTAVVQTTALGWANNFGKTITITVGCASGQNWNGSACVPNTCPNGANNPSACNTCTAPLAWSGSACVPGSCSGGQNNPPACTTCPGGTHDNGSGTCVANTCGNGLDYALYGPSCTCPANQHQAGASCVVNSGSITQQLQANPNRVRKNGTATLSWATQGMTSCSLSQNGAIFNANAPLSSSNFTSPAIISATTFTLSCSDGTKTYTSSASVTILPSYIEI